MIETIYAQASGRGKGGVAVIRVSGPQALHSFEALTQIRAPERRKAHFTTLKDPVSRETIDQGLALFFENPSSYTGEDTAEYHVHGSKVIIERIFKILSAQSNHRMAEPGEFTRRAFENGKLDLTEAEAVNDLINAQTELQHRQALRQLEGALKELYGNWTKKLSKSLAYIEADLEFPDEDDADGVTREVLPVLESIAQEIEEHLSDNRRGEILRDGFHIAIVGAPNAGKSSLLNVLAQRDVAIVSDMAGTTRDIIEVSLDLKGYPVILSDTAGLRHDEADAIEAEGIRRAVKRAEEADLKILLYDGQQEEPDGYTLSMIDENSIAIASKADLPIKLDYPAPILEISSYSGKGVETLLGEIIAKIEAQMGNAEAAPLTRLRHRNALESCLESLKRAKIACEPELMAEDVRLAVRYLGHITGRVDVEDLLDIVFRDFCIGK